MVKHLEETDIPISYRGMNYKVSPSALRSKNLTVNLPEFVYTKERYKPRTSKKAPREYKSAFNPAGAAEFAGTILNTPLILADRGANAIGIEGTPVQTTAQRVGETFSPTRWIGTARSGFKESPWSENNPGLTGDPYLDVMIDIGIGGLGLKGSKYIESLKTNKAIDALNAKQNYVNNQVKTALQNAKEYKLSEGYKTLLKKARQESKELGFGEFSDDIFINAGHKKPPLIKIEKRPVGSLAGYTNNKNKLSIDVTQLDDIERNVVPYHEGLHYNRIGTPELNTPKYKAWLESYLNNASKDIQDKLWDDFYGSSELIKYIELDNADNYLNYKVQQALKENAKSYLKIPGELQANGLEAGKVLDIKPFSPYPGGPKAFKAGLKAQQYNSYLNDVKLSTENDFKRFWDILTGNYIPSAIPLTIGGKYIYNNLNNNNK